MRYTGSFALHHGVPFSNLFLGLIVFGTALELGTTAYKSLTRYGKIKNTDRKRNCKLQFLFRLIPKSFCCAAGNQYLSWCALDKRPLQTGRVLNRSRAPAYGGNRLKRRSIRGFCSLVVGYSFLGKEQAGEGTDPGHRAGQVVTLYHLLQAVPEMLSKGKQMIVYLWMSTSRFNCARPAAIATGFPLKVQPGRRLPTGETISMISFHLHTRRPAFPPRRFFQR